MDGAVPDLTRLAATIRATFPDLAGIGGLRLLDSGFGSIVVETDTGIILRVAKHPRATEGHIREARLLPALAPHLPLPVPVPHWHAGPSAHFPFGIIGYRKLDGRTLSPALLHEVNQARLAAGIASFLAALHRFPAREARRLGLTGPERERALSAALRDDVLPTLRAELSYPEFAIVARWWEDLLADEHVWHYPPILCHGDLWYGNLLVNDTGGRLVGVLDFENAAVGDAAQDLATQLHLGEQFAACVIAAYVEAGGVFDGDRAYRVRRRWELREFDGLRFAIEACDAAEVADAIGKLRRGPLLGPRQPLSPGESTSGPDVG